MIIETQEIIDLIWMFGPGLAALLVLVGLLVSMGTDMARRD